MAAEALPLLVGTGAAGAQFSVPLQTLLFFGAVSFLPAVLLLMTAFTRIVIVLSLLRQALGTPNVPPQQVITGLSLFLTFFVMAPTLERVWSDAYEPFTKNQITASVALARAEQPLREFMLRQTRPADIELFSQLAKLPKPPAGSASASASTPASAPPAVNPSTGAISTALPLRVLLPAFVTSELKSAFQIGFLVFIPFLVIDLIVASVLASLGLVMLSPVLVALPFKLMLFVLADGWNLLLGSLAASFKT